MVVRGGGTWPHLLSIIALPLLWALGISGAQSATVRGTVDGIPSGGSVQWSNNGGASYSSISYGGSIHVTRLAAPNGGDFTGQLLPGDGTGGRGFLTFCGEHDQNIGYSTYTFNVEELFYDSAPDIGTTKAGQIKQLLYHVYPAFGQPLTSAQGLALQIIIWEIEKEPGTGPYTLVGSGAGQIRWRNANPSSALTTAQGWLDSYVNNQSLTSFSYGVVALTNTSNQDLIAQTKDTVTTLCRKLRLKSASAVSPVGSMMFGTAAFNATLRSDGKYDVELIDDEGIFDGNGLVYNDGQFPLSTSPPCSGTAEECLPYQSPDPLIATRGAFSWGAGDFDLDTWVVSRSTGGGGDKITFGPSGTYSYSGSQFAPHDGTYKVIDCVAAVPAPGALVLLLPPLVGLVVAAGRRRRRASNPIGA